MTLSQIRLIPPIDEEMVQPPGTVDAYRIDVIGKMECHCPQFVTTMKKLLGEPIPLWRVWAMD